MLITKGLMNVNLMQKPPFDLKMSIKSIYQLINQSEHLYNRLQLQLFTRYNQSSINVDDLNNFLAFYRIVHKILHLHITAYSIPNCRIIKSKQNMT